jgi:lipopolysaccharide/colanic/teichoic acid biosynthesis glycosyltransferase
MSFVGPRPERPEFVSKLAAEIPHYEQRLLVKPGLTGWAQVAFRYGSSVEDTAEKLRYDLYYIKNMGLSFDFFIVLSTVRTVVYDGGAH